METRQKNLMNEKMIESLNAQANHELFAAHSYEAMAVWCDDLDYNGFAAFFQKQAEEERGHARRFLKHLTDRGATPSLTSLEAPRNSFSGLTEIAGHAVALELQNTSNVVACYELAVELKEVRSLPFLLEFVDEQVEEESWTNTMITLCRRNECPGSQFDLDRHIEKVLGA